MSLSERHLQTIEQVKRYLAEHDYPFVKKAVLYGSCARQEAHYDSDVDILIVVTDNAFTGQIESDRAIKDAMRIMRSDFSAFEDESGHFLPEADVHFVSTSSYEQADSTYLKEIRKDGVAIYDSE